MLVVSGCELCCDVVQVVLVTDGSLGIGKGSLRHSLQTLKQRADDKKFPLPFPFPTKMFIMCVANSEEVSSPSIDSSQSRFFSNMIILKYNFILLLLPHFYLLSTQ